VAAGTASVWKLNTCVLNFSLCSNFIEGQIFFEMFVGCLRIVDA
jgi:hypothetical protein